jgi:hypothetical protein
MADYTNRERARRATNKAGRESARKNCRGIEGLIQAGCHPRAGHKKLGGEKRRGRDTVCCGAEKNRWPAKMVGLLCVMAPKSATGR